MPAQCSICLASLREPVCLPCGHIYCTKCIVDYVNTNTNEGITASCPTCRAEFHLLIPDKTYLPQKYHPYIAPAIRRVYLDESADIALQNQLTTANETIRKLKKKQDTLLRLSEQHLAAINAHKQGERAALMRVNELDESLANALQTIETEKEIAEEEREKNRELNNELAYIQHMRRKKKRASDLAEHNRRAEENSRSSIVVHPGDRSQLAMLEPEQITVSSRNSNSASTSANRRPVKPLPARRDRARSNSPADGSKRRRIVRADSRTFFGDCSLPVMLW